MFYLSSVFRTEDQEDRFYAEGFKREKKFHLLLPLQKSVFWNIRLWLRIMQSFAESSITVFTFFQVVPGSNFNRWVDIKKSLIPASWVIASTSSVSNLIPFRKHVYESPHIWTVSLFLLIAQQELPLSSPSNPFSTKKKKKSVWTENISHTDDLQILHYLNHSSWLLQSDFCLSNCHSTSHRFVNQQLQSQTLVNNTLLLLIKCTSNTYADFW